MQFTVPSVPVAQPRHRHSTINGMHRTYIKSEHPVHAFKAAVQIAFREACKEPPLDGPVLLIVIFVLPRPKKYFRKKDEEGRIWCTAKPDMDNLVKSLKDALKNMAWRDDAQVCVTTQWKQYASKTEQPCVEVSIEPVLEM